MNGYAQLPAQFEVRFVVGRVLWFLPVLIAMGALVWKMDSPLRALMLAKYAIAIGLIAWTSFRKAGIERFRIERFARNDLGDGPVDAIDNASSHAGPLAIALVLVGAAWSAVMTDIRWLYLTGGLGLMIGIGLGLRWLIYERWVIAQLRTL